jgi:16S rRNA (guanine1207-N2)-methyltransferase
MIDINERAVELAKRNAEMNGVRNVRIWQSDLYEKVETRDYDVILSNPPIRAGKQVVFAIFSGAYDLLKDGGSLWIVIQKKQGAPSAFEKLQSIFPTVEEVTKEKGYRIYRAVK